MNEAPAIKSKRDLAKLKKAMNGRDLLLFTVALNTGLRISDILPLTVGDLRKSSLTIREQKTGKSKSIAINESIKAVFNEVVPSDSRPESVLFPSRKGGRPISRVTAYRSLNAALERSELTSKYGAISPHSLRKTFGYHALKGGADITLLMRIFNHSSARVTLRYVGIEQGDIDAVYERVRL